MGLPVMLIKGSLAIQLDLIDTTLKLHGLATHLRCVPVLNPPENGGNFVKYYTAVLFP